MLRNRYYVQEPILSIHSPQGGERQCVYVPAGEVISVEGQDPANSAFVDVHWDSKTVKVFQQDLEERAELVSSFAT